MPNKKISELTELDELPAIDDLLAIVDVDVSETKRITFENLLLETIYDVLKTDLTMDGYNLAFDSISKITDGSLTSIDPYTRTLNYDDGSVAIDFSTAYIVNLYQTLNLTDGIDYIQFWIDGNGDGNITTSTGNFFINGTPY